MKPRAYLILGIAMIAILCLGGLLFVKYGANGFSARSTPSRLEVLAATYARDVAIPKSAKNLRNPVADSAEVQQEAMAHFADHCAVCHANNGSGDTMLGNGMYPKPPDLRGKTQSMSDGELFYVIENGVRMSGMPAFGGEDSQTDSWKLVRFIRHLPTLSSTEEEQMELLNPKGPEELKEEKEEEEFLGGGSPHASKQQERK